MILGDKKTITKPTREKVKDLVALLTFSSSPIEKIYLNPDITKDATTSKTESDMASWTTKKANSFKSPKPVKLRDCKSISISFKYLRVYS